MARLKVALEDAKASSSAELLDTIVNLLQGSVPLHDLSSLRTLNKAEKSVYLACSLESWIAGDGLRFVLDYYKKFGQEILLALREIGAEEYLVLFRDVLLPGKKADSSSIAEMESKYRVLTSKKTIFDFAEIYTQNNIESFVR